VKSRRSVQFQAPAAGASEARIFGKHYMAALFADKPVWPLQHCPELIARTQYGQRTTCSTIFNGIPALHNLRRDLV